MERCDLLKLIASKSEAIKFIPNSNAVSSIWGNFVLVNVEDVYSNFIECINCKVLLKWKKRDGTSGLMNHTKACPKINAKIGIFVAAGMGWEAYGAGMGWEAYGAGREGNGNKVMRATKMKRDMLASLPRLVTNLTAAFSINCNLYNRNVQTARHHNDTNTFQPATLNS
ncbi:hypothetical protein HELRODRAFT_174407 [Helobdella robusta]|uniref:BED-type domain-containing protein n=1 Tax=Helobdella robusta TaxID=6412 RepID=T1F834_HELRO|nr:hypothetical protein HELRODRAFT_174407 [Helobdella robusta]ESO02932.1 hypothetical protein HELRODRAFT_174407 [Helobdella robusta]